MIGNEFERLRRNILINMGEPSGISYLVKTDNSKIYFELANTPIANFGTVGNQNSSITVNGQSVVKNTIKELVFGISYENITSIPIRFCMSFLSMTSVNLSVFSNVTSVGNSFMQQCLVLTSIDLAALTNVSSIGNDFLWYCGSLTSLDLSPLISLTSIGKTFMHNYIGGSINIGSLDFSSITTNTGFTQSLNFSDYYIYADTLALGNAFKAKFPNISNWTVVVN